MSDQPKAIKREDRQDMAYALRHADSLLHELIKLDPERARRILRKLGEDRDPKQRTM